MSLRERIKNLEIKKKTHFVGKFYLPLNISDIFDQLGKTNVLLWQFVGKLLPSKITVANKANWFVPYR